MTLPAERGCIQMLRDVARENEWAGLNMRANQRLLTIPESEIVDDLEIALGCVALLWAVYFLNPVLPFDLRAFGIRPRSISGVPGIVFAPFLHYSLGHLLSDSLALAPLLSVLLVFSRRLTLVAVIFIIIIGGMGTWLFGPGNTVHAGASSVVFGLIGCLLAIGLFRRELMALLVALVAASCYGWALFFLSAVSPGGSWTGHFCGFMAGAFAAWISYERSFRHLISPGLNSFR